MPHRLTFATLILVVVVAEAGTVVGEDRGTPAFHATLGDKLDFVASVVDEHIEQGKLVGAVTWCLFRGDVIHHEAHGSLDREASQPMRTDAIFRIHSFTKAVTNVAAMMLWEEGRFQLDDPVFKYLPEFSGLRVVNSPEPQQPTDLLTVRDLMRHTSGIVYPNENGSEVERLYAAADVGNIEMPLAEFSATIARLPVEFSPGERWKYGMSIDLLGRLIEVWAGESYEGFVRRRVLKPLGMVDTDFFVPRDKRDRLATLYELVDGQLEARSGEQPGRNFVPSQAPPRCAPGGGLYSTASDYGAFLRMVLQGGASDGQTLLKPKTVRQMTTNQLPENIAWIQFGNEIRDGFTFGLGFNVVTQASQWDPHARVGEFGWGGAASCHYWVRPQQEVIVITLESTRPYNRNLELALKGKVYAALDD